MSGWAHESEILPETVRVIQGKVKGRQSHIAIKAEITYPSLLLSMSRGATARTYVQVQMSRRMTSKRDWKLKSAD